MIIKIYSWEKMQRIFGMKDDATINVEHDFTDLLESDLPDDREIDVLYDPDQCAWRWGDWLISQDMTDAKLPELYTAVDILQLTDQIDDLTKKLAKCTLLLAETQEWLEMGERLSPEIEKFFKGE